VAVRQQRQLQPQKLLPRLLPLPLLLKLLLLLLLLKLKLLLLLLLHWPRRQLL
jgi:hypothetical protein